MPSITARQVIEPALRLIGVAAAEQPISADMAQSALDAFNAMLDSWSVEGLLTYTRPKLTLTLLPGQAIYTWGQVEGELTPADIPAPAPVRLDLCLLTLAGPPAQEWAIEVIDQAMYETQVWLKALTSSYPSCVYLEPTQPYARLHIWPIPDLAYALQLIPWPALPPYDHLDTAVDWPTGYLRPFQYNVAIDVAPSYGVEPSPTVLRIAEESKRSLYPINARVGRLSLTPGRPRGGTPYGYPRSFLTGR